ncbi:MAG: hypothetical protein AB1546_00575 [bacterium]
MVAGISDIFVTFFSGSLMITEMICGSGNALEKKVATVRNAFKSGLNVGLNALLLKQSVHEINQILLLFSSLLKEKQWSDSTKIPEISITFPDYTGNIEIYKDIVPSYEVFTYYVLQAVSQYAELDLHIHNVPRCGFPKEIPFKNIFFKYPKPLTPLSDPYKDNESSPFGYKIVTECERCDERKMCAGIPRSYLAVYQEFYPWKVDSGNNIEPDLTSLIATFRWDTFPSFLSGLLKNFSYQGWNFDQIIVPAEKTLQVYFKKNDKMITIIINPRDLKIPGFCVTKNFSLCYQGSPDTRMPRDAEAIIKKMQKLLIALERTQQTVESSSGSG